ncbi:MAG: S-layer protein [Thermoproteota archaeon]
MQIRKFVASSLAALMAGATFAGAALAAVNVGGVLSHLGQQAATGTPYLVVVGDNAAASDIVGAIDVASALAQQVTREVTVPGLSVATLTGGVALDTADSKLYLGDEINKVKTTLTANDLPEFLASGSIEDENGVKYEYSQYLTIGDKQVKYEQPDTASGLKDPTFLIRLGTSVDTSNYLLNAWVTFNKEFDATKAVGKELSLFGKTFVISSETDNSQLVLFGTAGEDIIQAGETKTIRVGDNSYTVEVVGITNSNQAVIKVNGVTKEVSEGNTYDFRGVSVYVSDIYYIEVPTKTGYVKVSIGADRYVLKDGQPIMVGTAGNEKNIDGTHVKLTGNPTALSKIDIYFDAYTASPAVDYIKAGSVWTDPVFGIKVAYNGPASISTETITVQPGSSNYYTVTFTDKYGKSGTIQWAYYSSGTNEILADSVGNVIHVVEGEDAKLNEYIFATSSNFPHLLKVTSLNVEGSSCKATLRDVLSGAEYKVDATTTPTTLIIDGVSYTVTCADGGISNPDKISIKRTGASDTVVYPVLETKYGAKIALTKADAYTTQLPSDGDNSADSALKGPTLTLPTGTVAITYADDGSNNVASVTVGSKTFSTNGVVDAVKVGNVYYVFTVTGIGSGTATLTLLGLDDNQVDDTDAKINRPALLIIEEPRKGETDGHAMILPVDYDSGTDSRLELGAGNDGTPLWIDGLSPVSTSSDDVKHYVTVWGTKVVYDKSGAGRVTITYPDSQVYHLVAVGKDPRWTTQATEAGTYKTYAPLSLPVAKLAREVTTADKTNANIVLVGGPCANSLVQELINAGKMDSSFTCYPTLGAAWTPGAAYVQVIEDAFATGRVALVVAGTNAEDTRLATSLLSQGKLEGQTASKVKVTGTVAAPVITPM